MDQVSQEPPKQIPKLGMGMPAMSVKTNLVTTNPKTILESNTNEKKVNSEVHLEIKKRSKNKAITYVKGLPESLDKEKLVKTWRTKYCCNCSYDDEGTISLGGDRREDIVEYLIENNITLPEYIKVHGY